MTLENPDDYDRLTQGDALVIEGFAEAVKGADKLTLTDKTTGESFTLCLNLTERQRAILSAGGMLNYTKQNS